jgi:hypothetical protein
MSILHRIGAHKLGVLLLAILLLLVLLLLPRKGEGAQDSANAQDFGDFIIHYNAISTNRLVDSMARQYHIERSAKRGLLNIAVEHKHDGIASMVDAQISADVSDLTGHHAPISMRETSEGGDVDYLGEFPLTGSGAYIFTVKVTPHGLSQPFVVRFNQDYVID